MFLSKFYLRFILSCSLVLSCALAQAIELTPEEKSWLEAAPVIKTQNSSNYAPFDFISNGQPTGFSIEYLQLLGDKVGLKFEFVQGKTWSEYKQFAEDRHIDLLHLVGRSKDRERYLIFTDAYFIGSPSLLYGKKSQPLIKDYQQLANKKVAVIRDSVEQRHLSQYYPQIELVGVDTIDQGLNALLKSDSDYFLCYPSVCDTYIAQRFLSLIESRGHLGIVEFDKPKQAHFAVRSDWPLLASILNKAIASVSVSEKKQLLDKWIDHNQNRTQVVDSINEDEKRWIANNKRLIYSQPTAYSPYSYVEEDGRIAGLASNLVNEFDSKYSVNSYYVDYPNWTATYQALLDGEIDFIPTININEKRKQQVLLTEPVLTYYLTIFSHDQGPVFDTLDDLRGFRIGISKNSSVANLLQSNYPELNYVTYNNGVDVYRALSEGKIDATATSPHVMYQTINEYGLDHIVESAPTEFKFELAIAIHPSKPELLALFNKMIADLGQNNIDNMLDKWTKVKVIHRTDWLSIVRWVVGITLLVIVITASFIGRNRLNTIKLLADNDKRLNNAQRVAKIGNWELTRDRKLTQLSQQVRTLLGIGSEIALSQKDYQQFVHPDDKEPIKQRWKQAMKTGIYQHEYRITVSGEQKWVREVAELSFDKRGTFKSASGIIQDITEQKQAELQVKQNESELRELTSKLLHVQEEERKRVARELHDDLSQRLAVIAISIGTLELDQRLASVKAQLHATKQDITSVANDVHGLSRRLHPSILDDLGLIDALRSEISSFVDREMIAVNFETTATKLQLGNQAELGIFRITQEALRNIAKYSEASKVLVTLNVINQQLRLRIIDDGIGFDVQQAMRSPGLGLQSMTERARLIRADINIESSDQGTIISVNLPIA